jgi:ABC-type sugar transport system permease subunit
VPVGPSARVTARKYDAAMRRSSGAYAFIAFPLAILFLFTLLPTVAGLALSLFEWDGGGLPRFVGLANFAALERDPRFGPALKNTLVYVIGTVPLTVALGFGLAVAVHAKWFVGKTVVRTALFLPTVVSIIATGFVWRWMLDDAGGLVPAALRAAGVRNPPSFLQGGAVWTVGSGDGGVSIIAWPMVSVVAVSVWRGVGFAMVLYLAALGGVNESLYEAAEVDGASRWGALKHITWPGVAPMTVFLLVTGVIGALQVFDIVWAMTTGTETMATTVLNLYVYREFQQSRLGYAAAIGVVIFALTVAATAGQVWVFRRARA